MEIRPSPDPRMLQQRYCSQAPLCRGGLDCASTERPRGGTRLYSYTYKHNRRINGRQALPLHGRDQQSCISMTTGNFAQLHSTGWLAMDRSCLQLVTARACILPSRALRQEMPATFLAGEGPWGLGIGPHSDNKERGSRRVQIRCVVAEPGAATWRFSQATGRCQSRRLDKASLLYRYKNLVRMLVSDQDTNDAGISNSACGSNELFQQLLVAQ